MSIDRNGDRCHHLATVSKISFHTISAIILAGGRSSRMGTDKALLPHPGEQGVTFVEHLTSLLASYSQEVLLVARDAAQAIDYAVVEHRGARILTDETPDYGPLMGLYSGLRAMRPSSTHALLVAVDMPFVQPALISFMLSQPLGDALLVPLVEQVAQVLLAVYPRTVVPRIEACLRKGRRDPRSLLAVFPVHYLEEAQLRAVDPLLRSFVNINTPEDLQ
jgi:molybdopterin-guanine dinucleotide biosynthesis protein A